MKSSNNGLDLVGIGVGLNKEQKKRYRKQFVKLAIDVGMRSLLLVTAIVQAMRLAFLNKGYFFLSVTFTYIVLDKLVELIFHWSDEAGLIIERIERRKKKNKKTGLILD